MVGELGGGALIAGDFRVEVLLGRGGMGAVYRVVQLSTDRPRALKLLHPLLVEDEAARERFFREARIGSRIASDHVVEVIAAGVDGGTPWLAMELLEGEDLAKRLKRGPLGRGEARAVFSQLGEAVAAAHAVGVVHRDLKPENIFLTRSRQGGGPWVKVLDFGIAKLVSDAGDQTAPCGTPWFMAPEQATGSAISPAADVWALGLLAFRALTGHHYWRSAAGANPSPLLALREAAVDELPAASRRAGELGVAARLPPGFDDWFARCVVRTPAARFSDAGQASAALSPLLDETAPLAIGDTLAARPVAPPSPARSSRGFRRAGVGALALGVAAISAWWWLHRAAPSGVERWVVPIGEAPVRGPADALVTIVEFGDFACPYTKRAAPGVQKLLESYPNKVRLVWKDYPMGSHRNADAAAQLAREALRQKGLTGFWQAHDKLFAVSPALGRPDLETVAAELGLDVGEVSVALNAERYRLPIDADVDLAARIGGRGTPTFFVNGRRHEDFDGLEALVADELAEARRRAADGVAAARLYDELQRGAREIGEPPRRVTLPDPGDRPARGGPAGKALPVHEFCDLSTFKCALIEPLLKKTLDAYGDEVRLVWWDVTDPQQPGALLVMRAAKGADDVPGGFWKMHDRILASQLREGFARPPAETLAPPALREHARAVGADLQIFDYMVAMDGTVADDADLRQARELGIPATSIVVDGTLLSGLYPPHLLRIAIDRALARRK